MDLPQTCNTPVAGGKLTCNQDRPPVHRRRCKFAVILQHTRCKITARALANGGIAAIREFDQIAKDPPELLTNSCIHNVYTRTLSLSSGGRSPPLTAIPYATYILGEGPARSDRLPGVLRGHGGYA